MRVAESLGTRRKPRRAISTRTPRTQEPLIRTISIALVLILLLLLLLLRLLLLLLIIMIIMIIIILIIILLIVTNILIRILILTLILILILLMNIICSRLPDLLCRGHRPGESEPQKGNVQEVTFE